MSEAIWNRFAQSLNEGSELDLDALRQLDSSQRRKAAKILLEVLRESQDDKAIVGLGELGAKAAIEPLTEMQQTASGPTRRLIDVALWQIEGTAQDPQLLIEILRSDPFWGNRMRAAVSLRTFEREVAEPVLLGALDDETPLVRHHAVASIGSLYGVSEWCADIVNFANCALSADETIRKEGYQQLRDWLAIA